MSQNYDDTYDNDDKYFKRIHGNYDNNFPMGIDQKL